MVPLLGLVPRLWVGLPSCVELSEARRFVWPASCISHEGNREASVSDRGWCRSLAFGNKLDLLLVSNGSASTDPWSRGSTGRLTKAHNSRSALSHHPLVCYQAAPRGGGRVGLRSPVRRRLTCPFGSSTSSTTCECHDT